MNLKKKIFGGNSISTNNQIEKFIAIIIIGYFGIKIIYSSFFNFYPDKYYFNNIDITTNEKHVLSEDSLTENITLNAYVPGIWNNEMTDFITTLVLCGIIYIFTNFSNKNCIDPNGNLNISFLTGYIIGLGCPAFYNMYIQMLENAASNNSSGMSTIKNIFYAILSMFTIFIIGINYTESENKVSYITYIVAVVLLLSGLIVSRKKTSTYGIVSYFYNHGQSCTFDKNKNSNDNINGMIETSGEKMKLTFPCIVFIILLFFVNEPAEMTMKNFYFFLYALLLGCLVSNISYFGFEYFLQKLPLKECNGIKDCKLKGMPITYNKSLIAVLEEEEGILISKKNIDSNRYKHYFNKFSTIKLIILMSITIMIVYLVYFYLKNK